MSRKDNRFIELRLSGLTYQQIADKFHISRQRVHQILTGYTPILKGEAKERSREHRRIYFKNMRELKGKEWQTERNRYFANKIKQVVLTYYGKGKLECVKCGFSDLRALSIDHINGEGHKDRVKNNVVGNAFYRLLAKNNYPEGYQTLCMNCQWIKRHTNAEYSK